MSEEDKPDPIEDVRKGLGLLFRAAKSTIDKLPTKDLEEVVTTGAREVGRAIENVAHTIEREVFHAGKKEDAPPAEQVRVDVSRPATEDAPKPEDPPKQT